MDRDIPTFNPIIINKIKQKNMEIHQSNLKRIKSSQSSRLYQSTNMPNRVNSKAHQLQEEKKTQIEKRNLLLFNKMKNIMNRNDPINRPALQIHKTSANKSNTEISRIHEENKCFIDRLYKLKPTINNKKMYEQRKKQLNILKFLGKYSMHSLQNQAKSLRFSNQAQRTIHPDEPQSKRNFNIKNQDNHEQGIEYPLQLNARPRYMATEPDEVEEQDYFNRQMKKIINRKKRYQSHLVNNELIKTVASQREVAGKTDEAKDREKSESNLCKVVKDIILFRTITSINGERYQIKIIRKPLSYEILCIPIQKDKEEMIIQFTEADGKQILQENNYDYQKMIKGLRITNGQLTYLDDHSNNDNDQSNEMKSKSAYRKKIALGFANPSHITEMNDEENNQHQVEAADVDQHEKDIVIHANQEEQDLHQNPILNGQSEPGQTNLEITNFSTFNQAAFHQVP